MNVARVQHLSSYVLMDGRVKCECGACPAPEQLRAAPAEGEPGGEAGAAALRLSQPGLGAPQPLRLRGNHLQVRPPRPHTHLDCLKA